MVYNINRRISYNIHRKQIKKRKVEIKILKRKIRKIILISLLTITTALGSYIATSQLINKNNHSEPYRYSQIKNNINNQEVIHKETLVNNLKSIGKLEVVQASLNHTVTIKKGYDNKLFRCNKEIQFQGIGKYILNLDEIKSNNIIINKDTKEITVYCKALETSVEVLEDQNLYRDEKGYLVFYDIQLAPEQMEAIKSSVKEEMMKKLQNDEYMVMAKEKASESVNKVLSRLTNENYKVNIEYLY